MPFSRSMCVLSKESLTCLRNMPIDRRARMLFTEDAPHHYLYHSLFHCCHLKTKAYIHRLFCKHRFWLKKFNCLLTKKKKKSHFRHHKTCPERGERSSSHCVISQPDIFVSTEVMNNWIISPDLQFCLGFSASVAWYRMIPRSFMNEWCLCQVNSPDLCFTPMVAFTDNHDLQKHEWEGSANLVSFFVLFLCFPPWL